MFPYFTFSNQEIDNLAIYMKNPNSIRKAHPLFSQMRQGCSQHLKETHGLMFLFLPPLGEQARSLVTGAGAALKGYQAEEGSHPWTQGRDETRQHPRDFFFFF